MTNRESSLQQMIQTALDAYARRLNDRTAAGARGKPRFHLGDAVRTIVSQHGDSNPGFVIPAELDREFDYSFISTMLDEYVRCIVLAAQGLAGDDKRMRLGRVLASTDEEANLLDGILPLELARTLLPNIDNMSRRSLELANLVIYLSPPESVRKYLRRLSRCYLTGMDAESVILCRAVVESCVNELLASRSIEDDLTMRQKLVLARKRNWIDKSIEEKAQTVWMRGNKAIHSDPDIVRDSLGTIEMTLSAAQGLLSAIAGTVPSRPT